ncbi:MAG: penicillin-insensitive murein endopeptidase [Pseudomonadota bacterium]
MKPLLLLGMVVVLTCIPPVVAPAQEARQLFGSKEVPAQMPSAALGEYAKGCLAGGVELPETGWGWQAMRLSRNRNWGHPSAVQFIERFAAQVQAIGWPKLYIGDISQPRGGPMRSGHRSHQLGLDIDIWLRRPSDRVLSRAEREQIGSPRVVSGVRVNGNWTPSHHQVLRAAAQDAGVARIFVNAAIKHALCEAEPAADRGWLRKIRPWWGHDAHFHVRLHCPPESPNCVAQLPIPAGDGCDATLAWWFSDEALNPKPTPGKKPRRQLTMDDLPLACAAVLTK